MVFASKAHSLVRILLPCRPHPTRLEKLWIMPGSLKIIVADDNDDAASTLSIILKYNGYDAHAVAEPHSALALAKELVPQVMLIDIEMPGMNGYELAQAVREDPRMERSMLVAITGYGGDHHRSKAMEAGFDHHLLKPVDTEEIVSLIEKFKTNGPGFGRRAM